MKTVIVIAAVLYSTAALAQSSAPTPPPTVGGKPLVQVKPRNFGKPLSAAEKMLACLELEDGSKPRLDCFDAVFPPKPPQAKPTPAKGVADCRFVKEEDERLACFNGFAESIPKFSARQSGKR